MGTSTGRLLEATAFGARHLLEVVNETGGESERVFAVGGGTKGGLWTQIISDITGISQRLPEQTLGAPYGDALLAGIACDLVDRDAEWSSMADTVKPDPDNSEIYNELYAIYRDLYPATPPTGPRPGGHTVERSPQPGKRSGLVEGNTYRCSYQ